MEDEDEEDEEDEEEVSVVDDADDADADDDDGAAAANADEDAAEPSTPPTASGHSLDARTCDHEPGAEQRSTACSTPVKRSNSASS